MLTYERLRELLFYDPGSGVFNWLKTKGPRLAGSVAGSHDKYGYVVIGVEGKRYKAHRLAWFYVYGVFPEDQIDHINRIKNDNRIANLRLATIAQNRQNLSRQRNNTSGFAGISFQKSTGKWMAYIKVLGKQNYLGIYSSLEEAKLARDKARAVLHPYGNVDGA